MDAPANYLSWGFVLISVPNLVMIASMIAIFVVALLAPFPHRGSGPSAGERRHE